jgi:heptosyltransferase I
MPFNGFWKKRSPISRDEIGAILIVKLSAIGDVVHTLPLLEVLRANFPDARIDWVIEEEASHILEGHGALDRIIVSRRKLWQRSILRKRSRSETIREVLGFVRELRSETYDLVIDMQGLLKSGFLTGLSRGRRKIGFTWAREGSTLFLSEKPYFEDQCHQHAIKRYLKAAKILGCEVSSWQGRVPVRETDEERVDELLSREGLNGNRCAAINPMARWETKLWEPRKFALLADRIQDELGMAVLFTGCREDAAAIEEIRAQMKTGGSHNLAGLVGLRELASLYTRCSVLITTDTGPMHIAAAMDCPVVALFGPTAPWRTGPYGTGHKVVRRGLACSPCFKKKCDHRSCMKGITVDSVLQGVREQLESERTSSPRAKAPPPSRLQRNALADDLDTKGTAL